MDLNEMNPVLLVATPHAADSGAGEEGWRLTARMLRTRLR